MSALSEVAYRKLNEIVERGKRDTSRVLEQIVNEFNIRRDIVVRPAGLDVDIANGLLLKVGDRMLSTTGASRGQMLSKVGLREEFFQHMVSNDETGLLADTIRHLFPKTCPKGILVREVNGLAKGVLSPAYRRMDASPIFQAFIESCLSERYVPFRAMNTDTRYALTFLLPDVVEVAPDEFCCFGIQIRTSDYGLGAMQMNLFVLRVICVNLATGLDIMRKVHLGPRFNSEDPSNTIELSSKTYRLDNKAVASAVTDAVRFSHGYFKPIREAIEAANTTVPNIDSVFNDLKKKGFRKDTLERVKILYDAPQPMEILPHGNSTWRLSNVISFLSQAETGDARMMMEDAAFSVLKVA